MEPFVQEAAAQPERMAPERLNWTENPAVKQLLDVAVSILAAEYIQTVKQHPDAFSHNGAAT